MIIFIKNGPFHASFPLYFRLFNTVDSTNKCPIKKFADDRIRTADLSLYQLIYNHYANLCEPKRSLVNFANYRVFKFKMVAEKRFFD